MEGAEKAEILWGKSRRVGKRGGNSTPSASSWRIHEVGLSPNSLMHDDPRNFYQISSRKLAAALWELHPYKLPLYYNTRRRVPPPCHRRRDDKAVAGAGPEPLHPRLHLQESSRELRRRVDGSPMQHHRSIEKSNHAAQAMSTSSCSSSTEIPPCNHATPSTLIELHGENVKSTCSLKTSTELLKVLNRVWSLEEHQVSSISLIKGLKKELDRARFRAKELSGGATLLTKNREQDVINAKVLSVREELENERKLRKNSKSLQRKLAKELYEVKSSLASISKELEGERMSRSLLEDLCDELAWGLRDCEREMHGLKKQKSDEDLGERDDHDQLILRIAQAWLDERRSVREKNPMVQNPSSQSRASIQNERNSEEKINDDSLMLGNPLFTKGSLESILLNFGASARRGEEHDVNDDGSSTCHSDCFEVEKTNESGLNLQRQKIQEKYFEEMLKQIDFEEKLKSSDWSIALSPSRLQADFEENMSRAMSYGTSRNQIKHAGRRAENFEADRDDISYDKEEYEEMTDLNSDSPIANIIRNHHSFPENGMRCSKDRVVASSSGRSFRSPVREWTEKLPAQNLDTSDPPLKFLSELKGSTLRAKLSEARSRGQKSRTHQKASIYPSRE